MRWRAAGAERAGRCYWGVSESMKSVATTEHSPCITHERTSPRTPHRGQRPGLGRHGIRGPYRAVGWLITSLFLISCADDTPADQPATTSESDDLSGSDEASESSTADASDDATDEATSSTDDSDAETGSETSAENSTAS